MKILDLFRENRSLPDFVHLYRICLATADPFVKVTSADDYYRFKIDAAFRMRFTTKYGCSGHANVPT